MKVISKIFTVLFISSAGFFTSCDAIEDIEECLNEFAEYEDRLKDYEDIEGDICDNQDAAQEFIDFLENEAKGSCIEEQLENQDQSLDDIIEDAKAKLAECSN